MNKSLHTWLRSRSAAGPLAGAAALAAALGIGTASLGLAGLAAAQATSPSAAGAAATGTAAEGPPAAAPNQSPAPAAGAAGATKPAPRSAQDEAGEPRAHTSAASGARAGRNGPKASDHVVLDTTTVTGNRELPKVMYVVPWKKSDIGDMLARPMNSILDEALAPVDRDVFRREVSYYQAVKADRPEGSAPPGAPTKQGEK
jgi:hypothetical protein